MRAADDLHVEWVEDEAIVLDQEGQQLHYLNPTAAVFFALVQEVGFAAAQEQMRQRFGAAATNDGSLDGLVEEMVAKKLLIDE